MEDEQATAGPARTRRVPAQKLPPRKSSPAEPASTAGESDAPPARKTLETGKGAIPPAMLEPPGIRESKDALPPAVRPPVSNPMFIEPTFGQTPAQTRAGAAPAAESVPVAESGPAAESVPAAKSAQADESGPAESGPAESGPAESVPTESVPAARSGPAARSSGSSWDKRDAEAASKQEAAETSKRQRDNAVARRKATAAFAEEIAPAKATRRPGTKDAAGPDPATPAQPTQKAAPRSTASKPTKTAKPAAAKSAKATKPATAEPAKATKPAASKTTKPAVSKAAETAKPAVSKTAKPAASKATKPAVNKAAETAKPATAEPATATRSVATKATNATKSAAEPAKATRPAASKAAKTAKPIAAESDTAPRASGSKAHSGEPAAVSPRKGARKATERTVASGSTTSTSVTAAIDPPPTDPAPTKTPRRQRPPAKVTEPPLAVAAATATATEGQVPAQSRTPERETALTQERIGSWVELDADAILIPAQSTPAEDPYLPEPRPDPTSGPTSDPDPNPNRGQSLEPTGEPEHVPVWARIVADPGFTPEHLAREAVRRVAPEARDWLAQSTSRYPMAGPDRLARLAADHFVRLARRRGALAGGPLVTATGASLIAVTQARAVLHIAAAYGLDPGAEERAAELLILLRVPRLTEPTGAVLADLGRAVFGYAVRRAGSRLLPFGAALVGGLIGARATADVATRAIVHYRPLRGQSQRSGQREHSGQRQDNGQRQDSGQSQDILSAR